MDKEEKNIACILATFPKVNDVRAGIQEKDFVPMRELH